MFNFYMEATLNIFFIYFFYVIHKCNTYLCNTHIPFVSYVPISRSISIPTFVTYKMLNQNVSRTRNINNITKQFLRSCVVYIFIMPKLHFVHTFPKRACCTTNTLNANSNSLRFQKSQIPMVLIVF